MTAPFDGRFFAGNQYAHDLDAPQARLVVAMRLWMHCNRLGRCPCDPVRQHLDSQEVARDFLILMAFMAAIWPEPIHVHSPCCRWISLDEGLMIEMVGLAAGGRRRAFDALLCDMLNEDARDRLFVASARLAASLA